MNIQSLPRADTMWFFTWACPATITASLLAACTAAGSFAVSEHRRAGTETAEPQERGEQQEGEQVEQQGDGQQEQGGSDPPNIVLILADDFGYGSTNAYGANERVVQTTNIDRLAAEGVRFTRASTPSSVCSPTRYGLLMGRYPWRTGKEVGVVNPLDCLLPDPKRMNLARWLRERGYRTATIGKWHLGYGTTRHDKTPSSWIDRTEPGPEAMKFQYSFNVPQNHDDILGVYFENGEIVGFDEQGNLVGLRSSDQLDIGKYIGFDVPSRVTKRIAERLTTRAIEWMEQHVTEHAEPFFLYFTPTAVHGPVTPSDQNQGTSGAGSYGDYIHDLDGSVGEILAAIDRLSITDRTMVIFSSDNGGSIPADSDTPQGLAINLGLEINGHLRGDKHTIWEGGTRVPLLVRMPETVGNANRNVVSHALVSLVDIFATIVDLLEEVERLPEDVAPDSISFLHALLEDTVVASPREYNVTASVKGIIAIAGASQELGGYWKWIEGKVPEGTSAPSSEARSQLYDLDNDPGETNDLSLVESDKLNLLKEKLKEVRDSSPISRPSGNQFCGAADQ